MPESIETSLNKLASFVVYMAFPP